MIRFENFSLARGTKPLFDSVSFVLHAGEKAALVGANGAGKSSVFAVLNDEITPDDGRVSVPAAWRIAHVSQELAATERSALHHTLDGDSTLREIERLIVAASAAQDGTAEAAAHGAFADANGYTAPARAEALLLGLGFTLSETRKPVSSFSGGWRMRLNLAQALMSSSDLLLLDEPTNHLDLDAILWLEDWLRRYAGTLIVISHDRDFLDSVCTVTLHIEGREITRYSGNYSQFETLRTQQLALRHSLFEKQEKKIAHLQSYIDRFRYKATKARQAQSRIKALEKMERHAAVHMSQHFSFDFRSPNPAPDPLLVMDGVSCGYVSDGLNETVIVEQVKLSVQSGQRIGLLGANGKGKSTLIKTLAGLLSPLTGEVRPGKGLAIGYFAQHQLETLCSRDTPLEHMLGIAPQAREQELRNFLGSFNFTGEIITSSISLLSGGERARLALALIIWSKPNLLLLDEPTNHLDLETRQALTMALAQFEGSLILVSHDRHLLRATTDQFMLVCGRRLLPFDGDLDDYRAYLLAHSGETASQSNSSTSGGERAHAATKSDRRKEKKREEAYVRERADRERRPLQEKVVRLEKEMESINIEQSRLGAVFSSPEDYGTERAAAARRLGELHATLVALEAEWIETQEKLENAK
ncbi:ATP-binding cassette subfamily F protein 3 [Paraburkholderia sp. BL27I4N3]|uniref:ATP-binding cassette domain-containing protein n=1 Tax=Paraburkholderia sp. BL27I4N3 TaxID=1938805 RepID=UPI000E25BB0C|nr:ATP-binding cassette domain-containing protein [Paraburkholderia sp. BL27I4N3]REE18135.1 ATP-binding cassette subfamily F protein 3 [Paraburkholderia sp. BL27I4N3]